MSGFNPLIASVLLLASCAPVASSSPATGPAESSSRVSEPVSPARSAPPFQPPAPPITIRTTSRPRFIPVSAAGAELMRLVWEAGGLRNSGPARTVVERLRREEALAGPTAPELSAPSPPPLVQALGNDVIVNNRALSACTCSNGRRMSEEEVSVAAWGRYVVASWNDTRGTCLTGSGLPTQSHAVSRDHGATFQEGSLLRGPGPTDVFHGDPTVVVNRKSGDFYISGILRQGSTFVGVVALRGHVGPDSLVVDQRKVIALTSGGDFFDKPWMAVDSLTGQVFVTWTNFHADFSTAIELQRLDAMLDPLGPVQVLSSFPRGEYGPQGSYPSVGPDGVLYVPYGVYFTDTLAVWSTDSRFEIRRSDDGGLSFGPPHVIATIDYHPSIPAPGYQRGFWVPNIALDVDRGGPHRGRVYAVWAENRGLGGAAAPPSSSVIEQENNGFFASATPFTPGVKLKGFSNGVDTDFFKFTGHKGQVFWFGTDTSVSVHVRLICPSDTSALGNYHLLHTLAPNFGGGDGFAAGLPYDGTFYLEIEAPYGSSGDWSAFTAFVPPDPGDRARDIRDVFFSYSDDGSTWSTPVRLNDDDPGYDQAQPQVAVDGRGRVHTCWLDWRNDPVCGTDSDQFATSSGDGGVTWGANRRLSDASSFWSQLGSCSGNNQGDYSQMAADSDQVYAAFTDSRLGDPDIFVDPSRYRSSPHCPASQTVTAGSDLMLSFTLVNGGNFATPLAWQVADDRAWLTGAVPGVSGQQTLAADGGSVTVDATFHAPMGCAGDSTIVRFVTYDPAIPGAYDTCTTVLRCAGNTAVELALVRREVSAGRVSLAWQWREAAGALAAIFRKLPGSDWTLRSRITLDRGGMAAFEDSQAPTGLVGYRLVLDGLGPAPVSSEVWLEIPSLALALEASTPNPSRDGRLTAGFTLSSNTPAVLEVIDLEGRRVTARAVGTLGPGRHVLRLDVPDRLPSGIYVVRLRQGGREVSGKAVVMR